MPREESEFADRWKEFRVFRDIAELVLSDAALLIFFVTTWISPFAFGQEGPHACMAILIMEFITVHSTTFLIAQSGARQVGLTALLYIPFVAFAAMLVRAIWPIAMFAWHVYGTVSVFRGGSEARRIEALVRWAICFALFVLCLGLAAFLPWPDLGWRQETTSDFAWSRGTGELVYHVTPAWGTLYFLGLTIADALLLKSRHSSAETNPPKSSLMP